MEEISTECVRNNVFNENWKLQKIASVHGMMPCSGIGSSIFSSESPFWLLLLTRRDWDDLSCLRPRKSVPLLPLNERALSLRIGCVGEYLPVS